jgi:hypothetical protein
VTWAEKRAKWTAEVLSRPPPAPKPEPKRVIVMWEPPYGDEPPQPPAPEVKEWLLVRRPAQGPTFGRTRPICSLVFR